MAVPMLRAGNLFVPNGSFELPPSTSFTVFTSDWENQPVPPGVDPTVWFESMGRFANTDPGQPDHLGNIDGTQAAFISNTNGTGFLQDFNTVDFTGIATHSFNSIFEVGRSYHLTAALTSSSDEPIPQGSSIQMSLYYRDTSSNIVTLATTNIVFETNVFDPITNFTDFTVDVPTVSPTNAWAGQHIGIEFLCTTSDTNLAVGFWDLDNVRLTSTIVVPNGSFETPDNNPFGVVIDSWQKEPQSPFFPTNEGPWEDLMGAFANTPVGQPDHLNNMDGNQAAFVFPFPGAGFFQDFNSIGATNSAPDHGFDVTLDAGKSYTVTAALTSSTDQPLTNGASIDIGIYYRDAASNMIILADTNVVFSANLFTNTLNFNDFSATIPIVKATDPWAGKTLGIQIVSTTQDPNAITGAWDLDNVRLTEKVATVLNGATVTNGQISFMLQSEPGAAFQILASTNIIAPPPGWSPVATITNTSGSSVFADSTTNKVRFYKALRLP